LHENYGDFIAPIISIITNDIKARFNAMIINNNINNQINNNSSFNSQYKFGLVNFNNNSNILVEPVIPINQIQPVNKILNPGIKKNNIAVIGNLNNPSFNNRSNQIPNNMNDNINNNSIKIIGNVNNQNVNNPPNISINNNKFEMQGQMTKEEQSFKYKDIIVINFMSMDGSVRCGIKCLPSDIFAEVEERLYKKYEDLRNTNNMFTANAKPVLRFKKLYENNIKDGDIIQLFKLE
jgi:hypothetical protein